MEYQKAVSYTHLDVYKRQKINYSMEAIVGGDALVPAISAASILAKVSRDAELVRLDELYPAYGFAQHKGYPTLSHLNAIRQHGVLPIHRRSFQPIKTLVSR